MSGTAAVLGTVAAGGALLAAVLVVGEASVAGAEASGAADLAALAASDARRGLSDHEPCALAEQTAAANHAAVTECTALNDGSMRVAVEVARSPLPASAAVAVAGPPRAGAPAPGEPSP